MSQPVPEAISVELGSLIAPSGVGYAPAASDLSGCQVQLEGPVFRDRLGVTGLGMLSPGCHHGGSEIGVVICDPPPAIALLAIGSVVRVRGILDYGFDVDERGTASYLRLRQASLGWGPDFS